MISSFNSSYNSICELFDFNKEDSVAENKKKLLELAKNNEEKPNSRTKLGSAFLRYIKKTKKSYDPVFTKNIKITRPDWLLTPTDIANQNKKILLEIAKKGESRPSQKTKLGKALSSYAPSGSRGGAKRNGCFDEKFYNEIRNIRPDWWSSDYKKQQIFEIAKRGENKPSQKTKIGNCLRQYVATHSRSYDHEFATEIKKLRPDWFVDQSDLVVQKKNEIINMAKNGEDRPSRKSKLGQSISDYIKKSHRSYDADFEKTLKAIRPDWFVTLKQKGNLVKQEIIKLAKEGKRKPSGKSQYLARSLQRFLNKKSVCYDEKFKNTIRALRPDWFKRPADRNKKILLKMANNKEDRPTQKTKIGVALTHYTIKSSVCFDPIFNQNIRKIRPDWFFSKEEISNQKKEKLLEMARNNKEKPNAKTKIGKAFYNYTCSVSRSFDLVFYDEIRKTRPDWFRNDK